MSEKTYFGNGRQKAGSEYINISICFDDLLEAMHTNSTTHNGKLYLNAVLARKRSDAYGRTHTLYVNVRMTEEERTELANGQVADKQELELQDLELRELLLQDV